MVTGFLTIFPATRRMKFRNIIVVQTDNQLALATERKPSAHV